MMDSLKEINLKNLHTCNGFYLDKIQRGGEKSGICNCMFSFLGLSPRKITANKFWLFCEMPSHNRPPPQRKNRTKERQTF